MSNLASNLVGKNINGWIVEKKLSKEDGTGGCFSSGYFVRNVKGQEAFMKAINLGYAFANSDPEENLTDLIDRLIDDFKYERDLLKMCGERNMDRIVMALDSGEYREKSDPYFVPYLVFELSKEGDIRRHEKMRTIDLAWRLHVFHGVCVGVKQLHSGKIAHQDLKPSNVLVFSGSFSKIADLGRATIKMPGAKFTSPAHCGDLSYAPIELLYGHYDPDWDVRRKGADLFMLGGVFAFLLANVQLLGLIVEKLPADFRPFKWRGGYVPVLAAVRQAVFDTVSEIAATVPVAIQSDVKDILLWLCNPEPQLRGHPSTVQKAGVDRFSLERIISLADLIAKRVQFSES